MPETVAKTGARSLVSLLGPGDEILLPTAILPDGHLSMCFSDITKSYGKWPPPRAAHVLQLLDFVRGWNRTAPMVIHCFYGISRSTAAAFIAACALDPEGDEDDIARTIRAASPPARPNPRLIEIADDILKREGRMSSAIAAIGPGSGLRPGVAFKIEAKATKTKRVI
jgi:predicted protein tyrosine phosphatase